MEEALATLARGAARLATIDRLDLALAQAAAFRRTLVRLPPPDHGWLVDPRAPGSPGYWSKIGHYMDAVATRIEPAEPDPAWVAVIPPGPRLLGLCPFGSMEFLGLMARQAPEVPARLVSADVAMPFAVTGIATQGVWVALPGAVVYDATVSAFFRREHYERILKARPMRILTAQDVLNELFLGVPTW